MILKEQADAITKPASMIVEWSWEPREVSADWKVETLVWFPERLGGTPLETTGCQSQFSTW